MLKGKVALVTGSTSGIGLAIARAYAKEGANVCLNGFGDKDAVEKERIGIEAEFGVRAIYSGADMSKGDQTEAMVEGAIKSLGSVDILVNNAGIQFVSPVEEFPPEKWEQIVAINLSSAFYATRAGFTKSVALETATFGITANAICPGYVWTPLVEQQIPDTMAARGLTREQVINGLLLHAQPTKQFVTVDEVAALAVYLTGDMARSITGSIITIDGGWTAA